MNFPPYYLNHKLKIEMEIKSLEGSYGSAKLFKASSFNKVVC
jgi:hypothetical protein